MEALRGADFTGTATPTSPLTRVSREQHDASPSSSPPPPAACCVPDRDDVGDCGLGAGEDEFATKGDAEGREGGGESVGSGKGFFEFYPFLNDISHNEIDGEAR